MIAGPAYFFATCEAVGAALAHAFMAAPGMHTAFLASIAAVSIATREGLEKRGLRATAWACLAGALFGLACALPPPAPKAALTVEARDGL